MGEKSAKARSGDLRDTFLTHFFSLTSYRPLVRSESHIPGKQYYTHKKMHILFCKTTSDEKDYDGSRG